MFFLYASGKQLGSKLSDLFFILEEERRFSSSLPIYSEQRVSFNIPRYMLSTLKIRILLSYFMNSLVEIFKYLVAFTYLCASDIKNIILLLLLFPH